MPHFDYPNEPIGGGNPYWRCVSCKRSDPEINGRLEGHLEWCEFRRKKESDTEKESNALAMVEDYCETWDLTIEQRNDLLDRVIKLLQ